MAMDDFGRVLVKLRVPARDVRADGGTLSFTNTLPKSSIAILPPRRIFFEMGLFSGLYKLEVNEYIAATRNRRGRKTFAMESLQAAPIRALQPI